MPTKKLAVQFTVTAILEAVDRADWLNNSLTMNQGIEPGPTANMITKRRTKMMQKKDIHSNVS